MSTDEAFQVKLPANLEPYRPYLQSHARRVAALFPHGMTVQNENHIPKRIVANPTGSRLGGAAFITKEHPWPRDRLGRRMLFVAQINLADMPPLEGFRSEGLLQFFIGDHGYFGIDNADFDTHNYANPHNSCVRYIPVKEYLNGQLLGGIKTQTNTIENGFFELSAKPFDQYPSRHDSTFVNMVWSDPSVSNGLIDATSELPHIGPPAVFGGGWAAFAQRDPVGFCHSHRPLLQIRSNHGPRNKPRIQWGDCGFATFFIRPEDLERWDFSEVAYYWDCY
ncbi:DUF1963 domain-containing protein [Corynebacterium canis]|uniref:DUF1963 domain-containing protein n=1 Tax=Corynebacterium canis TaxID=679663 RepID=A0A5C5UAF1_9CORY|nr:DUF1963 domain-containing protein [Corynebacterium canis]TWT22783.1 DUF1963 domain-containing protein [Corynebacterium canis]WJY74308.1 hypothetical protein CCANI_02250 [Corynebacterium canis]